MTDDSEVWRPAGEGEVSKWARNGPDDDVTYVLAGRINDVPQKRSKVVRIFLSSTFSDTYTERNALMHETFPKLKDYCRENYDLDFQVVDMRWGVRDEASDDHSASDLCMRELKSCQKLSIGPTFVALVSERYGSRPLPVRIPEPELNLILESLKDTGDTENIPLIEKWYKLDENAVPSEYVLNSLTAAGKTLLDPEELQTFVSNEDIEAITDKYTRAKFIASNRYLCLEKGRKHWHQDQEKIAVCLRQGALDCIKKGTLSKEEAHVFTRSVTDEEIDYGLLRDDKRDSRCLCFIRRLKDIKMKHPRAWRFIDQTDDQELETEAQGLLSELRDNKIPGCLTQKNIFNYTVPWSDNEGVNTEDHKDYINEFCTTMQKEIIRLVELGLDTTHLVKGDSLYDEILEHAHQGMAKCERFHGRTDVLTNIRNYIFSKNSEPFVIFGESGCGKTSIMAKAALMIPEWVGNDPDTHIVLRFLGTTPASSTIAATLTSVITQINRSVFGKLNPDIPTSFVDLRDMFNSTIVEKMQRPKYKHKRLVLVLDSLDQLSPVHKAHELGWFPKTLPQNVKLIFSTLPEEHGILERLKEMKFTESNYLPVLDLKTEDSRNILNLWLSQQKRKITKSQEELVESVIKFEIRPLYLKLIFDEILSWRSYQMANEHSTLQHDVESSILQLFDRLELKHGSMLVKRAFGYLTASANGLTEVEMEDLLSLDDDVLNSVFEYHLPPTRRLPSILWARIRADISEYIVDREADGVRVMAWYHRQFIEKAQRYFNTSGSLYYHKTRGEDKHTSSKDRLQMSQNMYEYFQGKWSNGVKKPFEYTSRQMKKHKFESSSSEADRYVAQQPAIFRRLDGTINLADVRYNHRKISEMPEALENYMKFARQKHHDGPPELVYKNLGKQPEEKKEKKIVIKPKDILSEAVDSMIFNYEFLLAWSACYSWAEMSEFLEDNESGDIPDGYKQEMQMIRQMFLLCVTATHLNPLTLGVEISGRMLPYYGILPNLTKLIDSIEQDGRQTCALLNPHYNLEMPGGAQLYVLTNHTKPIAAAKMLGGNALLSISDKLLLNSMERGEIISDVRPKGMPEDDQFKYLATGTENLAHAGYPYGANRKEYPIIACGSLSKTPEIFVMQADDGFVRHKISMLDHEDGFEIDGLKAMDKVLVVFSKKSPNVYLFNTFDGSFVGKLEGAESKKIHAADFVLFDDKLYLMSVRMDPIQVSLEFIQIGTGSFYDDSSDGAFEIRVDPSSIEDDWYQKEKYEISLENTSKLSSYTVAENAILACFAFEDGSITYFMDGRGPFEEGIDSDASSSEDEASDNNSKAAEEKKGIPHEKIHAFQRTVYTDYFPLHSITCLRNSVHESMILVMGCSEYMLGVYEMVRGETKLRVRKKYDGATASSTMKFLFAYVGGTMDIFALYFDGEPTMSLYASLDAHSRPISMIGVLDFDIMMYTCGGDGAIKFWNMEKAGSSKTPKFDRSLASIKSIITGSGPSPEDTIAITCYNEPFDRQFEVWDVMTGKRMETIQSQRRLLALALHETNKKYQVLGYTNAGELLGWDITNLIIDEQFMEKPKSASKKRLPERACLFDENERKDGADYYIETDDKHVYVVSSFGMVGVLEKHSLAVIVKQQLSSITSIDDILVDAGSNILLGCSNKSHYQRLSLTKKKEIKMEESKVAFWKHQISSSCNTLVPVVDSEGDWSIMDRSSKEKKLDGKVKPSTDPNSYFWALTQDGEYLVKVEEREAYLIRVKDERLLAKVSLYDTISCLQITPDGWFVLFGMPDKRLFILMISDPQNPDHKERVATAHASNASLDSAEGMELAEYMVKQFDSSDDELPERTKGDRTKFIDMEQGRGPGFRKRASTMHRTASRMTGADSDSDSDDEHVTYQDSDIVSQQLCNLQ